MVAHSNKKKASKYKCLSTVLKYSFKIFGLFLFSTTLFSDYNSEKNIVLLCNKI